MGQIEDLQFPQRIERILAYGRHPRVCDAYFFKREELAKKPPQRNLIGKVLWRGEMQNLYISVHLKERYVCETTDLTAHLFPLVNVQRTRALLWTSPEVILVIPLREYRTNNKAYNEAYGYYDA